MGQVMEQIDEELRRWISRQHMFFVGTAPLSADGHVNLSPKGSDTLRVLDARTVAYLDLTGSGVETIAHLRENGRIVIMLCAYEGRPRIIRLHGRGEVLEAGTPAFDELRCEFPLLPGARAIIRVQVERLSQSCGYSVPTYAYTGDRETLNDWAGKRGEEGLADYRRQKNRCSIDGLAGLDG